jgi:hypothetical protein
MRSDMWKVIVERPRGGAGGERTRRIAKLPYRDEDGSTLAKLEPMRRERTKWLSENLNPLKRFIEKQVGRPWSKVYSEIRAHVRFENTVQQHVLVHLDQMIARQVKIVDGVVYELGHWKPWPLRRGALYVDPRTDIVRRVVVKKKQRRRVDPDRIIVHAFTHLRRIDGVWYRVELAKIPEDGLYKLRDAVLKRQLFEVVSALRVEHGRAGVYAVSKRQLSKRELKKLGVSDGTSPSATS